MTDEPTEQPIEDEADAPAPHPLADNPLYAEVRAVIDSNIRRQEALSRQGIQLNEGQLLEHRLERFIEFVLPSTEVPRLQFEAAWAAMVAESLTAAERQVARMRLTSPGAVPPAHPGHGLIVPGAAGRRS